MQLCWTLLDFSCNLSCQKEKMQKTVWSPFLRLVRDKTTEIKENELISNKYAYSQGVLRGLMARILGGFSPKTFLGLIDRFVHRKKFDSRL